MFRFFLHIPHPEELDDEEYAEAWQQLVWLGKDGLLGPKIQENGL